MGDVGQTRTDDELEAQIQAEIDANPKPITGPIDVPARIKLQSENKLLRSMLGEVLELALPRNLYGAIVNRTRCIRCENGNHPGCSCICHLAMEMSGA